jgi:hypothetical protein
MIEFVRAVKWRVGDGSFYGFWETEILPCQWFRQSVAMLIDTNEIASIEFGDYCILVGREKRKGYAPSIAIRQENVVFFGDAVVLKIEGDYLASVSPLDVRVLAERIGFVRTEFGERPILVL